MDQISRNLNQNEPQDAQAYSVDDILSEFWEEYYLSHPAAGDGKPEKDTAPELPEVYAEADSEEQNRTATAPAAALPEEQTKEHGFEEYALEKTDALRTEKDHGTDHIDPIDTATYAAESGRRGKKEIWEDFPDTPP
ncbi:MAG: hypothetical protein J5949_09945, partial [Oscillospiraceae bacterium]|nr:hypothetical protein [Oscillospiraceae bacterium]